MKVRWSLALLELLVRADALTVRAATDAADAFHEANPRYITSAIIKRFKNRLR